KEQRQQAAEVAHGIQEVRIARGRVPAVAEPLLQKRGARGNHEERNADDQGQQSERVNDGIGARRRGPLVNLGVNRKKQHGHDGQSEEAAMQHQLMPKLEFSADPMRVGIAEQQYGLEEHHASVPDLRRATQFRQNQFANQRLNEE